jgi:S-methylmethionine-dependent homocysteine/selenocysteine methylase
MAEAAIVEPLRRAGTIDLHPGLVHAPLIYDDRGAELLANLYHSYMGVAVRAGLPFIMCTPTWRTNRQRIEDSGITTDINSDAVLFLMNIREAYGRTSAAIRIGGIVGCKNDCYRPEEGLPASEAERFHAWQIERLADAGVDFLIAETLPNVEEAKGIALAMEATGLPYVISFVVDRHGRVLDGTKLPAAVEAIDGVTKRRALGCMVNCAYPTFIRASYQPPELFDRLIGCLANGSSLDHCDLDGADQLQMESVEEWAEEMLALNREHGVRVLGGCCGTGMEHLEYIANAKG